MLPFRILNAKEKKAISRMLEEQWGMGEKTTPLAGYVCLMNRKNRLFIINRDIERLDTRGLRVNAAGLYIAELLHEKELRLSIEGSQILGPHATKNMVELDAVQARAWLKGQDLDLDAEDAFVILRHGKDYLGCGRAKAGKILNFVPKTRRILAAD